jgi:hypothetical protein
VYHLITYAWRPYNRELYTYHNMVIDIHPLDFVLDQINNSSAEGETVLLWAREISKEQFDKSQGEF